MGKQAGKNVITNPEERKKFKQALATITHYFQQIDDHKEGMKEAIEEIAGTYGLEKKVVRKLASVMYKHNYSSLREENQHFEILYETLIEGKAVDVNDPLDNAEDEDE